MYGSQLYLSLLIMRLYFMFTFFSVKTRSFEFAYIGKITLKTETVGNLMKVSDMFFDSGDRCICKAIEIR